MSHSHIIIDLECGDQIGMALPATDPSGGSGLPPATCCGQILYSVNGLTFSPQLPLTNCGGWMMNDDGQLLVTG